MKALPLPVAPSKAVDVARDLRRVQSVGGAPERSGAGKCRRRSSEKTENGRLHRSPIPDDSLRDADGRPCEQTGQHYKCSADVPAAKLCMTHVDLLGLVSVAGLKIKGACFMLVRRA